MISDIVIIAVVWSVFGLLLFLMSRAVYQVLKGKAESETELQKPYLEDEDLWMWAAIKMSVHDLSTFLEKRDDLKHQKHGRYRELNCVNPKHPITDSFMLPIAIENKDDVIAPPEMLEETTRTLGIKPQEVLRYIAKKRPSYLDR